MKRCHQAVFGFGGLGGLRWISSVRWAARTHVAECYTPEEIATPDTRYLSINGHLVAYREMGEGEPTIVLLHGFGMRFQSWDGVQLALARQDRTVALDLWGFGASARPPEARQEDWVGQVTGVMDALGIGQAVVVGHSLGGRVSLMCARQVPERVRGIILCDADFGHVPFGYLIVWSLGRSAAVPGILARLRGDKAAMHRLMDMVTTPAFEITPESLDLHHEPLLVKGTTLCWSSLARRPWLAEARALPSLVQCPAGVIWGADDPVIPVEWGQLLQRRLSAPELIAIPECGHFPQEERPAEVAQAVASLLERL